MIKEKVSDVVASQNIITVMNRSSDACFLRTTDD